MELTACRINPGHQCPELVRAFALATESSIPGDTSRDEDMCRVSHLMAGVILKFNQGCNNCMTVPETTQPNLVSDEQALVNLASI